MNYVESFNLFGIEAKEISCIKGSGVPTTATVGAVGMFYMDTDSGDVYKCTAVADGVYTWENLAPDSSAYFVTTYTDNGDGTATADHTYAEQMAAFEAGKILLGYIDRVYMVMRHADMKKTSYIAVFPLSGIFETYEISHGSDDQVEFKYETVTVPTGDVSDVLTQWDGKNFITLGDSITWQDGNAYQQGSHIGEVANGYQTILKSSLGFTGYLNKGVSGRSIAGEGGTAETAQTVDYTDYDLCIIAGGTNDFKLNVSLGAAASSDFDTTTFYGAYQSMIEYILTQKPNITLCLFTPLQRNNDGYNTKSTNTAGYKLIDYVNAVRTLGEMYSIPVCDLYANSGINELTLTLYTMDGLHPNDVGYERMGFYASKFIENLPCTVESEPATPTVDSFTPTVYEAGNLDSDGTVNAVNEAYATCDYIAINTGDVVSFGGVIKFFGVYDSEKLFIADTYMNFPKGATGAATALNYTYTATADGYFRFTILPEEVSGYAAYLQPKETMVVNITRA